MGNEACKQGNEDLCIPFLFPRTVPCDSSSYVSNEVFGRGTESAPGFRRPLWDVCARGIPKTDWGREPVPAVEEDVFEVVRDDVEAVLEEADDAVRPWGFATPLADRELVDFFGSGCCVAVFVFAGSVSRQMRGSDALSRGQLTRHARTLAGDTRGDGSWGEQPRTRVGEGGVHLVQSAGLRDSTSVQTPWLHLM